MIKISPYGKLYVGKCYKHSFSSKRAAKREMRRSRKNIGVRLKTAYQCKMCNLWHLSHLTRKEYLGKVVDYRLIEFLKRDLTL